MINVMLADSSEAFRKKFNSLGFWKIHSDVRIAAEPRNGIDALNYMRKNHIDILFIEINIPRLSGIELLRRVRDEGLCHCTILVSDHADFEYARSGMILGAFDYVVKSEKESAIEKVLERALKYTANLPARSNVFRAECDILAENLLKNGANTEELANDLIRKCRISCNENFVKYVITLIDSSKYIYSVIIQKNSRLGLVIDEPDEVESSLMQSADYSSAGKVFKKYIMDMRNNIEIFYPISMSELSRSVVEYVLDHVNEKITLTNMAEICYVSNTYLSHRFKKNMGISIVDYVTMAKMFVVKKLLNETELSISQIAERMGYDDYKYMGRIFKNIYGCTLSDYRKRR